MQCDCVPVPDTAVDNATLSRAIDLAERVVAGRCEERDDPAFAEFEYSCLYQWKKFCIIQKWNAAECSSILERQKQYVLGQVPGCLDMLQRDRLRIRKLLQGVNGSKEIVRQVRNWILLHAHSIVSVATEVASIVDSLVDSHGSTREDSVQQLFYVLYIVNDVLFNRSSASMAGPYTSVLGSAAESVSVDVARWLFPAVMHAVKLLRGCILIENRGDSDEIKLRKLMELWLARNVMDSQAAEALLSVASSMDSKALLSDRYVPAAAVVPPSVLMVATVTVTATVRPAPPAPAAPRPVPPAVPPPPPPPPGLPTATLRPVEPPMPPALPMVMMGFARPQIDLNTVPVGKLVELTKAAQSHFNCAPYASYDTTAVSLLPPRFVEPARLEARRVEFERKYESLRESCRSCAGGSR